MSEKLPKAGERFRRGPLECRGCGTRIELFATSFGEPSLNRCAGCAADQWARLHHLAPAVRWLAIEQEISES